MIGVTNPYRYHRLSQDVGERFSHGIFAADQKPTPDPYDEWPLIPEPRYPCWPQSFREEARRVSDALARRPGALCRIVFRQPVSLLGPADCDPVNRHVAFTYFGLGKSGSTRYFAPQFATQADEDNFLAALLEHYRDR